MKDDRRGELFHLQRGNVQPLRAGNVFACVFVGAANIDQRHAVGEQVLCRGGGDGVHAVSSGGLSGQKRVFSVAISRATSGCSMR